jgi:hypothetical protein
MKHKDPTELLARYRRISKDQAVIINRLNNELEVLRTLKWWPL